MLAPSVSRIPRFCVVDARSEPARSISDSLPSTTDVRGCDCDSMTVVVCCTVTWITAWDRDDTTLAAVGSVFRFRLPLANSSIVRWKEQVVHMPQCDQISPTKKLQNLSDTVGLFVP